MDEKMESSGRLDYLSMHESASVFGNVGKAPCFSLRLLLVCFLSLISKRLLRLLKCDFSKRLLKGFL